MCVHSVHRPYSGERAYAIRFKGLALRPTLDMVCSCVQQVRIVHHLCTVSTDHTQVNVHVPRLYKFEHNVYKCTCMRIYVCANTRICIRVFFAHVLGLRIRVFMNTRGGGGGGRTRS